MKSTTMCSCLSGACSERDEPDAHSFRGRGFDSATRARNPSSPPPPPPSPRPLPPPPRSPSPSSLRSRSGSAVSGLSLQGLIAALCKVSVEVFLGDEWTQAFPTASAKLRLVFFFVDPGAKFFKHNQDVMHERAQAIAASHASAAKAKAASRLGRGVAAAAAAASVTPFSPPARASVALPSVLIAPPDLRSPEGAARRRVVGVGSSSTRGRPAGDVSVSEFANFLAADGGARGAALLSVGELEASFDGFDGFDEAPLIAAAPSGVAFDAVAGSGGGVSAAVKGSAGAFDVAVKSPLPASPPTSPVGFLGSSRASHDGRASTALSDAGSPSVPLPDFPPLPTFAGAAAMSRTSKIADLAARRVALAAALHAADESGAGVHSGGGGAGTEPPAQPFITRHTRLHGVRSPNRPSPAFNNASSESPLLRTGGSDGGEGPMGAASIPSTPKSPAHRVAWLRENGTDSAQRSSAGAASRNAARSASPLNSSHFTASAIRHKADIAGGAGAGAGSSQVAFSQGPRRETGGASVLGNASLDDGDFPAPVVRPGSAFASPRALRMGGGGGGALSPALSLGAGSSTVGGGVGVDATAGATSRLGLTIPVQSKMAATGSKGEGGSAPPHFSGSASPVAAASAAHRVSSPATLPFFTAGGFASLRGGGGDSPASFVGAVSGGGVGAGSGSLSVSHAALDRAAAATPIPPGLTSARATAIAIENFRASSAAPASVFSNVRAGDAIGGSAGARASISVTAGVTVDEGADALVLHNAMVRCTHASPLPLFLS